MSSQESHSIQYLLLKARLEPHAFSSRVPVLGSVIVWFRNTWNSVSTRWYIAPLVQQQNEFNQGVVEELQEVKQLLDEISDRLLANDRDIAALTHDLGKVTYAVIRLDEEMNRVEGTFRG